MVLKKIIPLFSIIVLVSTFSDGSRAQEFIEHGSHGKVETSPESSEKAESSVCVECSLPKVDPPIAKETTEDLKAIAKASKVLTTENLILDPELIEKMNGRQIGELIAKRLHDLCDTLRDPELKKPEYDSEIIMLVPEKYLQDIAKSGFKNQHQTGVTGGCDCKENRLSTESIHVQMGLPYTNRAREILPKYALQVFKTDKMGVHIPPWNYGNVMIRFKPEVKNRATWVEQDSLGVRRALKTNFIRTQKDAKCIGYCEAQIWGDLDFTDVESIIVQDGTAITPELKALQVPIQTYKKKSGTEGCEGYYGSSGHCTKTSADHKSSTLGGIEISDKPVYQPDSAPPAPTIPNLSLSELQKQHDSETSPVKKNILFGTAISKMKSEELIKLHKATKEGTPSPGFSGSGSPSPSPSPSPAPSSYIYNPYGPDSFASPKFRILAELTGRKKTKEVTKFLIEEFHSSKSKAVQGVILSGLTHLPLSDLKPLLLKSLNSTDSYSPINSTAYLLGMQHKNDPEIKAALEKTSGMQNLFDQNKACKKGIYE